MFELLKQFCVTIQQQELREVDGRWISSVGSYTSAHSFRDLYITHLLTITFSALWGVLARKSFKREVCLTELAVKAELEYITGTERVWVWVWLSELGLWRQLQMEYCDRKSLRMSLIGRALAWEQLWIPYCDRKSWEWIWLAAWLWKQSWDIIRTERVWEKV